jgi:hypothetical protein
LQLEAGLPHARFTRLLLLLLSLIIELLVAYHAHSSKAQPQNSVTMKPHLILSFKLLHCGRNRGDRIQLRLGRRRFFLLRLKCEIAHVWRVAAQKSFFYIELRESLSGQGEVAPPLQTSQLSSMYQPK